MAGGGGGYDPKDVKKYTLKELASSLRRVNSLAWEADNILVLSGVLGAVMGALAPLGGFLFLGAALKSVLTTNSVSDTLLYGGALGFFLYTMFTAFMRERGRVRGELFDEYIREHFTDKEVEKLTSLDLGRLITPEFVRVRNRARNPSRHFNQLLNGQFRLFENTIAVLAGFCVLQLVSAPMVILALIPLYPALKKVWQRKARDVEEFDINEDNRRKQRVYAEQVEDPRAMTQNKLFSFTGHMLAQYKRYTEMIRGVRRSFARKDGRSEIEMYAINRVFSVCLMAWLGVQVTHHAIPMADAVVAFGSFQILNSGLLSLVRGWGEILCVKTEESFWDDFMNTKPLIDESAARSVALTSVPALVLQDVEFDYPGKSVLKGCSLEIPPGQKVALIAPNGSGKSTTLNLFAKVYVPKKGLVRVGHLDLNEVLQSSLLRHVQYMTQGAGVPELLIEEALTGCHHHEVDRERLSRAAHIAGINSFVNTLPKGYQTQIGRGWDEGTEFSQGQYQRLKLTMALYRLLDPAVYVGLFDEPLADCDLATQDRFHSAFREAFAEKTIVVVTHDILHLHYFDRVVMMENGYITRDVSGKDNILALRDELVNTSWIHEEEKQKN